MSPAAEMGLLFMVLAAGVIGGAAFAMERRERSAEFLAMLPVKRGQIIASKLLVSFAVIGLVMAIETRVLLSAVFLPSWNDPSLRNAMADFVVAGVVFSMGWVLSTFMNSTAIAASAAILLAICAGFIFVVVFEDFMMSDMMKIATCTAVIFVLIGNIYYVRRVAP